MYYQYFADANIPQMTESRKLTPRIPGRGRGEGTALKIMRAKRLA
jgi:hypothetical protein